jgi:beta-N-acetylhexosaminidase
MSLTIREAAGSLVVVGLSGVELTALERAWLKLVKPGGVILFRRNIQDVKQTRRLLDDVSASCAPHCVRCVDVEGGTVNRLRDVLAPLPSAQAVAMAAGNPSLAPGRAPKSVRTLAWEHGDLVARGVKAFGFNTTLAPVVDLALPESAQVMGTRSPAPGPAEVIEYAREFLAALAGNGVVGCGKHFPGLGGAASDTHFVTPEIGRSWQQIWSEDLVPYRELHAAMPMIMMNHAAYPHTPGKNEPASASTFWITEVLRKRIGYRGIILSDDLEMGGILKFLPVEEAAIAAINAGTDLLEICHSAELILRTYEALISEAERSGAFSRLLMAGARETARKRARLYAGRPAPSLTSTQLQGLQKKSVQFNEKMMALAAGAGTADPRNSAPAEIS